MKIVSGTISLINILLLQSCFSGLNISCNYTEGVDFDSYNNYEFYGWSPESIVMLDVDQKKFIEKILQQELMDRGIKNVDRGGELLVSVHVIVKDKVTTSSYTNDYSASSLDYSPGEKWFNSSSPTTYYTIVQNEGTLVIDIFDNHTKKLIWQGKAAGLMDEDPKSIKSNLRETITLIMESFPRIKKK